MKIYNSFGDMFNAQSGQKQDMSVFNRTTSAPEPIKTNPKFDEYTERYMPASGEGENQLEQILVGVNKLAYRYENDGECLNSEEDYDASRDDAIYEYFVEWLKDGFYNDDSDVMYFLQDQGYYDPDMFDDEDEAIEDLEKRFDDGLANEIADDSIARNYWREGYFEGREPQDGWLSHDSENQNYLSEYCSMVVGADPDTYKYIHAMEEAITDTMYANALNDLISFVTSRLDIYEGHPWQFKDIPMSEIKSWFK